MRIYVPSRDRASRMEIFRFLPADKHDVVVVVPHGQGDAYRQRCPQVWETPPDIQGISATRNLILREGAPVQLQVDDDLRLYARERLGMSELNRTLRIATPADIVAMLSALDTALQTHAHASISPRMMNQALEDAPRSCGRYFRFCGFNTALMPNGPVQSPLAVGEDLELAIQLYKLGLSAVLFSVWAHDDSRGTNSTGGCSLYRTHELQAESIHEMVRLHAPFVKAVEKKVKMGGAFGHRIDPKIDWKGLLAYGLQTRR